MAATPLGTGLDNNIVAFHLKRLELPQLTRDESLSLPKRVGSIFTSSFVEKIRGKAVLKVQSHDTAVLERSVNKYPRSISWMFHFYIVRNAIIAGNYAQANHYVNSLRSKKGDEIDLLKGLLAQINGKTTKAIRKYHKVASQSQTIDTLARRLLVDFAETPKNLPQIIIGENENAFLLSDVALKASCARDIYLSHPNDFKTITKALEKAPENEKWKYQLYLAQNHLEKNQPKEALSNLNLIPSENFTASMKLLKGEILFRQKEYFQSFKLLQEIKEPSLISRAVFLQNECIKHLKEKKKCTQDELKVIVLFYPLSKWHLEYMTLVTDELFDGEFAERLAQANDPLAMFVLGKNADSNQEKVAWYQKAAEQGYAQAQTNLGYYYQNGIGVEKDEKEAVRLYRLAAEQGNAVAQSNLGYCYRTGIGVEKDEKEAVRLYRLAAEQGNAVAQTNLGYCYRTGIGVEKDEKEAVRLHRLAAEQGNAQGQTHLGYCYWNGIGVKKDEKEAVRLYRLAVEQGDAKAQNNLGYCYDEGIGLEKDKKEAVRLYRLAAEQGNAVAQNNLGYCYYEGIGVEKDEKEAVRLYRLAAEQGNAVAQNNLGALGYF
jgi:TPR repeat protein